MCPRLRFIISPPQTTSVPGIYLVLNAFTATDKFSISWRRIASSQKGTRWRIKGARRQTCTSFVSRWQTIPLHFPPQFPFHGFTFLLLPTRITVYLYHSRQGTCAYQLFYHSFFGELHIWRLLVSSVLLSSMSSCLRKQFTPVIF